MSERTPESKIASWSSAESHLTIDYPPELLDEIRLTISSGFYVGPRGALEGAGVFFGTSTEREVRIAAWRPITREPIGQVLESAGTDSLLSGLHPVGWFVSHARGSLDLTESDLQVFNEFFPGDWQFTMVLQADLVGLTKAAFFVRNTDGTVSPHRRDDEFTIEPLRAARVHGRRSPPPNEPPPIEEARERRDPRARSPRSTQAASGVGSEGNLVRVRSANSVNRPQGPPPALRDEQLARGPRRRWLGWLWVVPVACFLIYAAEIARERLFTDSRPVTLALKLEDWPGAQLHVDWEKEAQPIQLAHRGEIAFEDAGRTTTMELDAPHLRLGSFAYARRSANVKVKLSVYSENNAAPAIEEVAEFNGATPDDAAAKPTPADTHDDGAKQKAELEAEIKSLRAQLATETAKRQELQNLVRVLENRLRLRPRK